MVYCSRCGAMNDEDAEHCTNCGSEIYPDRGGWKSEETCLGQPEKSLEQGCFTVPYLGAILGIIFGVFIIILGLGIALSINVWSWLGAFILIAIGLILIITGVILRGRRG